MFIFYINDLNNNFTVNGVPFIFDFHEGQFGYNTDANRGADTFHPFSTPTTIEALGGTIGWYTYVATKKFKAIVVEAFTVQFRSYPPFCQLNSVNVPATNDLSSGDIGTRLFVIPNVKEGDTIYSYANAGATIRAWGVADII